MTMSDTASEKARFAAAAAKSRSTSKASPEQVAYADLLFYGSWGAIVLMLLTYLLYVTGILSPYVPMDQVIVLWSGKASVYLHNANVPTGWGWLALATYGDFSNFLGIALLAGMTIICFIPLIPAYLKKREPIFAAIAAAEVLVLILAASGLVGTGGH